MLRFAPSPTGYLHVGNARIALLNYLFAKKMDLKFILRIDDTDIERSKKVFSEAIKEDLKWLGINFEECFYQSKRMKFYNEIAEKLKSKGKLYPCYETTDELSLKRKIQLKAGKPPIYDRTGLKLSKSEKQEYEGKGRKPHWRLLLEDDSIEWIDLIHKKIKFDKFFISDPVLIRSDDTPLFTLTSVVDDVDYGITHILRGDDHLTNTAAQITLFKYLDSKIPVFGHFPLMKNSSGEGLSKRFNSGSLKELRKAKINPNVLNTLLARIGTSFSFDDVKDLNILKNEFDFSIFSKNSMQYSQEDLVRLNGKYLKKFSYKDIKKETDADFSEEFWNAVKSNIEDFSDIDYWLSVINDKNLRNDIIKSEKLFFDIALKNLPQTINVDTWSKWTKNISVQSGKKGKDLYMILRLALTGMNKGPEMNLLLPLIDRDLIIKRLGY